MPLVRGHHPVTNTDWLLAGKPAGAYRPNIPRWAVASNLSALTTQVMLSVALPLQAGDVVTNLTFKSGATAAGTPTNWWFALYDTAGTLLAQSADQTTGAWAADTAKTLSLSTPQLIHSDGVYYAAVMVKATTPPTLIGAAIQADASGGVLAGEAVLARTSGSGLTATAPATITGAATVGNVALVIAT